MRRPTQWRPPWAPADTGFLPADLANNEMVISQWLADDLGVAAGGEVALKYFVMGERRQLEEKARKFTVRAVLPMTEPHLNTSWMPEFPGLSDKKNCRDWKPGFDFDSKRMRDKDQQYWEQYRGTPKAFVNLKVGRGNVVESLGKHHVDPLACCRRSPPKSKPRFGKT